MSESERWQQIKQVLHQALAQEPGARPEFLAKSCAGDEALKKEVESLLASYDQAGSFFETPVKTDIAKVLTNDKAESLVGKSLGPYRITSQLGVGGMGEVYLGEDARLHRPVALKLLATHFASDEERVQRFRQEAFAASALNHPNIVTVYEIGEWMGRPFIAGEFVDGVTLRTRMRSRRLRLVDAIEIALQIAGALAAAHRAGIVHRDIKPENIMVRPDGLVKILDFGIAKYIEAPFMRVAKEALVKTMQGAVVGTAAYMSPEQARGLPVDERTDIWSLGVILYEMSTRQLPFPGKTPSDRIAAILERDPLPLPEGRRKVPLELEQILNRTLAKNKEERYAKAADLAADLGRVRATFGDLHSPRFALPAPVLNLSRLSPGRMKVVLLALLLVFVVAAFAGYQFLGHRISRINSLAVLPLANDSTDPNLEYLSDGIGESLINNLSHLPNVKVMSRNSVFRYKGKQTDAQTVGRELGVQAVLTGRVVQHGEDLTISVELVDARDNTHIWGEQYNRKLSDLVALHLEISRQVSDKLRLSLTGQEQQQVTKAQTQNPEAYQLFLKGRYFMERRTKEYIKRAVKYFEEAIDKDPGYALAYAELSNAYSYLGDYEEVSPKENYLNIKSAVTKALDLDSTLGEAHAHLAELLHNYEWDWAGAEREFKTALELNPNYAETHHLYSHYLMQRGRVAESLVASKRNLELDPLSTATNLHLGWHYLFARQFDQAIAQEKKTLEMDPNYARAYIYLAEAYEQKGMLDEAVEAYLKHKMLDGASPEEIVALKAAYARAGIAGYWRKALELELQRSKSKYVAPYEIAVIYGKLGEKNKAFEMLDKAYAEHSTHLVDLNLEFAFDGMRSDPRFADLQRRVGLPQ